MIEESRNVFLFPTRSKNFFFLQKIQKKRDFKMKSGCSQTRSVARVLSLAVDASSMRRRLRVTM